MFKTEVDMDNKTIKRHKEVITIKIEKIISFEGREKVIIRCTHGGGYWDNCHILIFFYLDGYKGVISLLIIKLHIFWCRFGVYFTIKRLKEK